MGKIEPIIHEDYRRKIVEYIPDLPIRTAKIIFMKEDAKIGGHYHKMKSEVLYILKGSGTSLINGQKEEKLKTGDCIMISAGLRHYFSFKKGSIILEAGTLPYDPTDEII